MRFQTSAVMDAIERRLTTDVVAAQAVVDIGAVARCVELDGGRPVNLVRIGMVLDALSRYLVDEGAMLYGVAERALLSDQALTSKERMVLGRWLDDGVIEVTSEVADRPAEIADLTGIPLIVLRPDPAVAKRYPWLTDGSGRALRLVPRGGVASLRPLLADEDVDSGDAAGPGGATRVVASAKVPTSGSGDGESVELPLPAEVLTGRPAARMSRVRVSGSRFHRGEPAGGAAGRLVTMSWRCDGYDCPAFGERRQVGQPVPRLRDDGVPVCPRHGEPVSEVGPRPKAYPVSIVVDDLPRRRIVVREGEPVEVGRAEEDPRVVSVAPWLHEAAASWISPVHVRLEVRDGDLVVTDLSENGTVVWQRTAPDDRGATRNLRRAAHRLGEWDTVELYTGIELARGDRRLVTVLGRDEPGSVLVDAPTAAHHQVRGE
ncbi:MAG TPA: FHA domain-containing protein [Natronosporangium sp.]